ncbi:hypothetical protein Droror1_Dr00017767 [Drosera rotundifolia]
MILVVQSCVSLGPKSTRDPSFLLKVILLSSSPCLFLPLAFAAVVTAYLAAQLSLPRRRHPSSSQVKLGWTRSNWAFLNEPPVIEGEQPRYKYASQYHVANRHSSLDNGSRKVKTNGNATLLKSKSAAQPNA